jgi:gamma-glutamyltranspeptidase/glutathione hydrolase
MEHWNSRRSSIYSTKGICSSSQPLASAVGVKILQNGGNAADAAVAMAAVLNLTEPCSTGIGGDAFALYYEASTKKVHCLQGNGASAGAFTFQKLREKGFAYDLKPLDPHSGLCVTVPGAAALWDDLVTIHGKLPLSTVLAPAIELAENGFPIHPVTSDAWNNAFIQGEEAIRVLRPNNSPVHAGQLFVNKDLAQTFRTGAPPPLLFCYGLLVI